MSIFEYDEEKHMKSERKEWREIGYREGREEGIVVGRADGMAAGRKEGLAVGRETGISEGLKACLSILKSLIDAGKNEEINRVLSDSDYIEQLCHEYFQKENS